MAGRTKLANATHIEAIFGSAVAVPEFVDPALLAKVEAIQLGYAGQMQVPSGCRARLLQQLSAAGGVAVLVGGVSEERAGSDTEILFRQESNFIYLSGFDHPGAKLIVGLDSNGATLRAGEAWLFVPRGDAVWQGRVETLDDFKAKYDVTDVFWIDDFDAKLTALYPTTVYTFSGVDLKIPDSAEQDTTTLRGQLAAARVVKTDGEIELLRAASEISVDSHKTIMAHIKCGNYESEAESLFRYVSHNYGARFQAYIPIVGAGANSAALHYNDNDQVMPEGGVVLVDAGAELGGTRNGGGWTADITRTWPCNGRFSEAQRGIYDAVFEAQDSCVKLCVPGQSMSTATAASNKALMEGLLKVGILKDGTVEQFLAANIHRLFMPHGLGHSVGLDVHDPGSLSPFAAGMVVTCEPGIYFYPSLLVPAFSNPEQGKYLNQPLIQDTYMKMGGFRLEDTVLITAGAPDNLSVGAPRTAAEIEAFMAKGASVGAGNRGASFTARGEQPEGVHTAVEQAQE